MDFVIIGLLILVGIIMFLTYQKINTNTESKKISDEIGVERKVTDGINQLKSKQDDLLKELSHRLQKIDLAQADLNNLKTEIIDFKNLFNNQTSRGRLGNESLQKLVADVLNKKHYRFEHQLSNGKRADCFLYISSGSIKTD